MRPWAKLLDLGGCGVGKASDKSVARISKLLDRLIERAEAHAHGKLGGISLDGVDLAAGDCKVNPRQSARGHVKSDHRVGNAFLFVLAFENVFAIVNEQPFDSAVQTGRRVFPDRPPKRAALGKPR